jgi:hypothetical protein
MAAYLNLDHQINEGNRLVNARVMAVMGPCLTWAGQPLTVAEHIEVVRELFAISPVWPRGPLPEGTATCDLCGWADDHSHPVDEYGFPEPDDEHGFLPPDAEEWTDYAPGVTVYVDRMTGEIVDVR